MVKEEPSVATPHHNPHHKEKEEFLVSEAHTVVHPGAVVIHPSHTCLACRTVVRFWRFHWLTFLASLLQDFHKTNAFLPYLLILLWSFWQIRVVWTRRLRWFLLAVFLFEILLDSGDEQAPLRSPCKLLFDWINNNFGGLRKFLELESILLWKSAWVGGDA